MTSTVLASFASTFKEEMADNTVLRAAVGEEVLDAMQVESGAVQVGEAEEETIAGGFFLLENDPTRCQYSML